MALGDYRIVPGLVTEEIDQEILVCDTDLAVVHRVSGPAADVLRQVLASGGAPAALQDDDVTSGLVTAGVLVAADAPADLFSRRSFVNAAAAVGAMGIVTLALPRAAAASSVVGGDVGGGGDENGSNLPPAPDSGITTTYTTTGINTGRLTVNWVSEPEDFFFDYVIDVTSGGVNTSFDLSGRLASGFIPTEIYRLLNPSTISVQFTSITSPPVVVTLTFSNPPA